jgi:uncharacterized damage-inducible protein DinB
MDVAGVLEELYGRIPPLAESAVEGLDEDRLARAPEGATNGIGWLVWHIARLQDHHMSELLEVDQLWVTDGWAQRFDMEPDPDDMGYGHDPERVASVRPEDPQLLLDYLAAAQTRTESLLAGITEESLTEIIDRRWDPPVTLGVRLVSVADDSLQHLGQAAYLRGLFGW